MERNIEIVADDNNLCGESPVWDYVNQRMLWVDSGSPFVFQYCPSTSKKTISDIGLEVSGIAVNRDGGMIVAGNGLHLWHSKNDCSTIVREYEGETLIFNDIIADAKGCIYAGTLYWNGGNMYKTGKLYLINNDGSICVVDDSIELSNGLGFSPGDKTLYYADSAAGCIYKYDVETDSGELKNKRIFIKVPKSEGIPDGVTVDAEGYIWSAIWYGGKVVRYNPWGGIDRVITMPVKQVSSVMFGGNGLNKLYVTSAREYWHSDLAPDDFNPGELMGGQLYRINLDICGKFEHLANYK